MKNKICKMNGIVAYFLIFVFLFPLFCNSATLDENISSMIKETLTYNKDNIKGLDEKQKKLLEEGKPVIQLVTVKGDKEEEKKENFAKTVIIIDQPAEALFNVLIDLNNYSKIFSTVKISKILKTLPEKDKTAVYYYQQVALPIVPKINSSMKLTYYKNDSNKDGKTDNYIVWWKQDDSQKFKDENGKAVSSNLVYNWGSWNIIPIDKEKSLIFYNIISEPEFYVPAIVWSKANTWVGIPNVLKELKEAAKQPPYNKISK